MTARNRLEAALSQPSAPGGGETWNEQDAAEAGDPEGTGGRVYRQAPRPSAPAPVDDKTHPRFVAGYDAGTKDSRLERTAIGVRQWLEANPEVLDDPNEETGSTLRDDILAMAAALISPAPGGAASDVVRDYVVERLDSLENWFLIVPEADTPAVTTMLRKVREAKSALSSIQGQDIRDALASAPARGG